MLVTLCENHDHASQVRKSRATVGNGEVGLKKFLELKAIFGYAASGEMRLPGNDPSLDFSKGP
jgi:hypothetical protein